jgi:hypothetical protein
VAAVNTISRIKFVHLEFVWLTLRLASVSLEMPRPSAFCISTERNSLKPFVGRPDLYDLKPFFPNLNSRETVTKKGSCHFRLKMERVVERNPRATYVFVAQL